jgi:hypothetical protein
MFLCSCGPHTPAKQLIRPRSPHVRVAPGRVRRPTPRPRARRFAVPLPVMLTLTRQDGRLVDPAAVVRNLSQTGAFVRTAALPAIGQSALLRFACGGAVCAAAGSVVQLRAGRGFAIELAGANGSFDALLCELEQIGDAVQRDVLGAITSAELLVA